MPMPEGILIAHRSTASGCAAMHPTAAFAAHRWRSARVPAPGPGSATECSVLGLSLAVHQAPSVRLTGAQGALRCCQKWVNRRRLVANPEVRQHLAGLSGVIY